MFNFETKEFDCKCDYECGLGYGDMNQDFVKRLDAARSIAGTPFSINSAVRCKRHNEKVGGSEVSSHLTGLAVDLRCLNSSDRFVIVNALIAVGIDRIGIGENFIHCDCDPNKIAPCIFTYY